MNKNIGFIDNNCGVGNILAEIVKRRLNSGLSLEETLSTLYGVEYEKDNVELCRERLLCGREDLRHIVNFNIVCADALTYHYRFDGTDPNKTDQDIILEKFIEEKSVKSENS